MPSMSLMSSNEDALHDDGCLGEIMRRIFLYFSDGNRGFFRGKNIFEKKKKKNYKKKKLEKDNLR